MRDMQEDAEHLAGEIARCQLCAGGFAVTRSGHRPRPVPWFRGTARLLIAGQAPGLRVHETGIPFNDHSGDRLRDWLGIDRDTFYDRGRIAVVPMAFCFPGYDAAGSDLPPPPVCAETWRRRVMAALPEVALTILVGGHAQRWHMGLPRGGGVTQTVADWRSHAPGIFPLPHPSWRNTGWLRKNPWFEAECLPELRDRVRDVLS